MPLRGPSNHRRIVLAFTALSSLALATNAHGAELVNGLGGPAGYGTHRLAPSMRSSCDDVWPGLGPIDLRAAFPEGFLFFGQDGNEICVNANGTLSFGVPYDSPVPMGFPLTGTELVAGWWAGIDIRSGSIDDPTRDAVYWDVRPGQFVVTWHNVGHDSVRDGLVDDFQFVIRTSGCFGAKVIEFRYHRCDWTAANGSGGSMGRCSGSPDCIAAVAGFDAGDLTHYYMLPGSTTDAVADLCRTSNVGEPGVWRFHLEGNRPCPDFSGTQCNTGEPGACLDGITICENHSARCARLSGPTSERCDGVDNDCDGEIDEGTDLCPVDAVCSLGACVSRCIGGRCPSGSFCSAAEGCSPGICPDACPAGQHCTDEGCMGACDGVRCPAPTSCFSGDCIDPCERIVCPEMQVCARGGCVDRCDCAGCPSGSTCGPDGRCQRVDCGGSACTASERCVDVEDGGVACVDPCADAVCPRNQRCERGRCVEPTAMTMNDGGADAVANDGFGDAPRDGLDEHAASPPAARSGCSCRTAGESRSRACFGALAVLLTAIIGFRRRRSHEHTPHSSSA